MSIFTNIKDSSAIELFAVNAIYQSDPHEFKVNLASRSYLNENGEPWVLPAVRQAEVIIAADPTLMNEFLPSCGLKMFCDAATKLLLGSDCQALCENRVLSVQVMSGTGGLRLIAEFLSHVLGFKIFYISSPTRENHKHVFLCAEFEECRIYRYWSDRLRGFDVEAMLEDLRNAPQNSVIILQASGHNPTGCDPTYEDWRRIADVMKERQLFPVIDCAYQGLVSGELDKDVWSVRYIALRGFEFFVSQSFSKIFGLYNERIGNMICVTKTPDVIVNIESHLIRIIRSLYSRPPAHGARLVAEILTTPFLYQEWKDNLRKMALRIQEVRKKLRNSLEELKTPGNWEIITSQIGMYSYTGMTEHQCLHMLYNHHIYMLRSGRINVCGLTSNNINYVTKALNQTIKHIPFSK
ncbi:hypothetical protein Trydic_g11165 [Trypoxylus dichotomus]